MGLVTVVRSNVGETLELPGNLFVRPWHYVEITGPLTAEMSEFVRVLKKARVIQVGQVLDGSPLSKTAFD